MAAGDSLQPLSAFCYQHERRRVIHERATMRRRAGQLTCDKRVGARRGAGPGEARESRRARRRASVDSDAAHDGDTRAPAHL